MNLIDDGLPLPDYSIIPFPRMLTILESLLDDTYLHQHEVADICQSFVEELDKELNSLEGEEDLKKLKLREIYNVS